MIEIDRVFWDAFLFGAYDHRKHYKNDPNHGLIFPMPQSLVISNLTLPYLPIFSQIESATLNIKKTSWKNAKKFIKALDKQKILKSKDRDGGETFVIDINFDDAAITEFVPYEMPKKETKIANDTGENIGNASSSRSDDSVGQRLKRIHLFRPKEQLSPIFEASKLRVKDLYSAGELRPVINSYVESENLISATKKHLVTMNPILANALFDSASSLDHEVLTKGSVPRDALIERFMHSCSPFWVILRNDDTRDTVKAKPGLGPKVQLTYETRSGNKTVTKISGLEVFHLNPHLLADELQKTCASSTSVNQLMGSSPKNPVQEILVQGPQKDAVFKALEMRGVHKNWVDFVSKVKGGKK